MPFRLWAAARWRVPRVPAQVIQDSLPYVPPVLYPVFELPKILVWWAFAEARFDRAAAQRSWTTPYTPIHRRAMTFRDRWDIGFHRSPPGLGPEDRRHTGAFPDLEWARGEEVTARQAGNPALAL